MSAVGDSRPGPTGADVMPPGLSQQEAARRLAATGPNELRHAAPPRAIDRLVRQFASPVIWLLLAACVMSAILGELLDAAAIAVILGVNAGVGFFQERRAERAIEALGAMTARRARVVRDGRQQIIAARAVVPGDVLLLEAGDIVAADARLVEAHALTLNEAVLTGESFPVHKSAASIAADVPGDEPRDVVFMGTSVAAGTAIALVEATGMSSEFGKIAHRLETAEESATPLQRRLEHVSRWLAASCAAVVAVVAAIGVMRGWSAIDVFMSAVRRRSRSLPRRTRPRPPSRRTTAWPRAACAFSRWPRAARPAATWSSWGLIGIADPPRAWSMRGRRRPTSCTSSATGRSAARSWP